MNNNIKKSSTRAHRTHWLINTTGNKISSILVLLDATLGSLYKISSDRILKKIIKKFLLKFKNNWKVKK